MQAHGACTAPKGLRMPPARPAVLEIPVRTEEKDRQHMPMVEIEVPEEGVILIMAIAMPLGSGQAQAQQAQAQAQAQLQVQAQRQATMTLIYGIGIKRDIYGRSIVSSSIYGVIAVVVLSRVMSLGDHRIRSSISLW